MKKSFWIVLLICTIAGCSKDKGADRNYTASSVVASSDMLLGGGCVDQSGNFIVFSPPTFEIVSNAQLGNFKRNPSFKKFSTNGQILQEYPLPALKWQYYQGSNTWDTINGVVEAWDPSLKVTLAVTNDGSIVSSNSTSGLISSYSGGNNNGVVQLQRVSAISIDDNDNIYALLCATYNNDRTLRTAPEIVKVSADGSTTSFFTFPSHYTYPVESMWGNSVEFYPMDLPEDIFIGKDGYVYVAMCLMGKTFRISPSGEMEELTNDIVAPISIATDEYGNVFITSAPLVNKTDITIIKPVEVIEVKVDHSRKTIYQASAGDRFRGHLFTSDIPDRYIGYGSTFDVSVSLNGDVFLVDPLERKIVRIY